MSLIAVALLWPEANAETADDTVVAAEYAFARAARERGIKAAFANYLGADSLICAPLPTGGHELNARRSDRKHVLEWYPAESHTAASGELGYTLGPFYFRSEDGKQEAHGTVFTMWRRQADGAWRVALDCGTNHEKPAQPPRALGEPRLASAPEHSTHAGEPVLSVEAWRDPVAAAEERFAAKVRAHGLGPALRAAAGEHFTVMNEGREPWRAPDLARVIAGAAKFGDHWQHVFTRDSRDGLLGYAWGYIGSAGNSKPQAGYVNVWRRTTLSDPWQLVVQIYLPLQAD